MIDAELAKLPVEEVISSVGIARAIDIKKVASLLFTYRCSIACRHCLFSSSPAKPNVVSSLEHGLTVLSGLRVTDRVIHIAGGEAMLYYDQMLNVCREAQREGYPPHFIETNASWCNNDKLASQRYAELKDAGVLGMLISSDPYHQEFVPPEFFLRARAFACDVFGEHNVITGHATLEELEDFATITRDEKALSEYVNNNTLQFVGRAGEQLAHFLPDHPLDDLAEDVAMPFGTSTKDCDFAFNESLMWEIHIDPYGNIQTCCGVIIGNINGKPFAEYYREGFNNANEIVEVISKSGPFGLLALAIERGYNPRKGYPQKCNLCWEVRKFLRPYYPHILGPAEIYETNHPAFHGL